MSSDALVAAQAVLGWMFQSLNVPVPGTDLTFWNLAVFVLIACVLIDAARHLVGLPSRIFGAPSTGQVIRSTRTSIRSTPTNATPSRFSGMSEKDMYN